MGIFISLFRQELIMYPRLAWNSPQPPKGWDYRYAYPCPEKKIILILFCDTGDWVQGFMCAKKAIYHWPTTPVEQIFLIDKFSKIKETRKLCSQGDCMVTDTKVWSHRNTVSILGQLACKVLSRTWQVMKETGSVRLMFTEYLYYLKHILLKSEKN